MLGSGLGSGRAEVRAWQQRWLPSASSPRCSSRPADRRYGQRCLVDRRGIGGGGRERVRERGRSDRRPVRARVRRSTIRTPTRTPTRSAQRRRGGEAARLIVQNGVGYDAFMNKIESASPNSARKVIDVQNLLGLPNSTPNPHLWYDPKTMPTVAEAMASDLSGLDRHMPHTSRPTEDLPRFARSMARGDRQRSRLSTRRDRSDDRTGRRLHARGDGHRQPDPVAVPGGHHERCGSVASGRVPAERFLEHMVKVFGYNQQVVDSLTRAHRLGALNERGYRRGCLRDDADPRIRLPVVDAGRGRGDREGRGQRRVDPGNCEDRGTVTVAAGGSSPDGASAWRK